VTLSEPSMTESNRPAMREYTSDGRASHSHRRRSADRPKRVRAFYFGLASIWGFAVGASTVAAAVRLSGIAVDLDFPALALVGCGVAFAIVGGFLAAEAYREARRRHGDN
jgi:hypothetical protein